MHATVVISFKAQLSLALELKFQNKFADSSPPLPDLFHFFNMLLHFCNFLFSVTPLGKFYTYVIKIVCSLLHKLTRYINTFITNICIVILYYKLLHLNKTFITK